MTAAEFDRRMAEHWRRLDESMAKQTELYEATAPTFALYSRLTKAGIKIKAWHVTQAEADRMDDILGQHDEMLGYPVLVDGRRRARKATR